jgi:hypothetical protein
MTIPDEVNEKPETDSEQSEAPDGSTNITEAQSARTEALLDGSSTDATNGGEGQDTASGGAPEDPA